WKGRAHRGAGGCDQRGARRGSLPMHCPRGARRVSGVQRMDSAHKGTTMTKSCVPIGPKVVGDGHPVFIIAEMGINHNGSLDIAKRMIDGAVLSGVDAVKFQKRTPERCVPKDQWKIPRETPWGTMSYIEYRHRLEFGLDEYSAIDRHCRERGILWFASCWDEESVEFMQQ